MPSLFSVRSLRSRLAQREIEVKRNLSKVGSLGGKLLSVLARFAGFLFSSIASFFNLTFSDLWGVLVEGYFVLKTFDWNATDKQLEDQIKQNNQSIAVSAADAIGNYLGFGAVRLVNFFAGKAFASKSQQVAQGIKVPVLSARVGLALAEEGNEELRSGVRRFLTTATTAMIGNAFLNLVLTARRNELLGQKSITQPQTSGSIATKIEEKIEKLPEFWRRPAEALIEGFEEGIIQAGYVVSYQVDDHVEAMRWHDRYRTDVRTVEVQFSKDSEEKVTVKGGQKEVREALTVIAPVQQLIENRDVGQILGTPADDYITLKPQLRHLNIVFYPRPSPPFFPGKRKEKRDKSSGVISVPDVKPGLTWSDLKRIPKYTRGDVFVKCQLKNGRSMAVYSTSFPAGKKILETLAALSTTSIVPESFRFSEGTKKKGSKVLYPAYATILYQSNKQSKSKHSQRIPIWREDPPEDFTPLR